MTSSSEFLQILTKEFSLDTSVKKLLDYNNRIIILSTKEDNEKDSRFFLNLKKLESYITKIKSETFKWEEASARLTKEFMKPFGFLQSTLYLEAGNADFLRRKFPLDYFYQAINLNYGRVGGSKIYDETIRASTNMLRFFLFTYLKKDLVFYPSITTNTCFLYDPIFRQKIREKNLKDKFIRKQYFGSGEDFNLKKFVYRCIDQYFPNVSWRWIGGEQFSHYYTLRIILEMFEYGLWEKSDLNNLLTKIYSISEIMYNLENYIYLDRFKVRAAKYFEDCATYCTKIRELIASIFLQFIIFYLDADVAEKIRGFPVNLADEFHPNDYYQRDPNINLLDLFKDSFFTRSKLYTYFTFILVTYLARYKKTNDLDSNIIGSENLTFILNLHYKYISDINGDFFRSSLKMMKDEYWAFYLLKPENSIYDEVQDFIYVLDSLINDIKVLTYGQLNMDFRGYLNKITQIIESIYDYLGKQKDEDYQINVRMTRKLVLTLYQIPHYILSLLHIISDKTVAEQDENFINPVLSKGIKLIRRISVGNTAAQNQIFSGYCYTHWKKMYDSNLIQMHYILRDLLVRNDNIYLIEMNKEIFDLIIKKYINLFDTFTDEFSFYLQDNKKVMPIRIIIILYFLNQIFSEMFETFSNKRSKYELIIASIINKIIPDIFIFFKNQNIMNIKTSSHFFKSNHKKLNELLKIQNVYDKLPDNEQTLVIYELFYSFLQLFYRSTQRFYTKDTYEIMIQLLNNQVDFNDYTKLLELGGGINILKYIVRIYSTFTIFPNNHLLNSRLDYFRDPQNEFAEMTIPSNLFDIKLYNDFLSIGQQALVLNGNRMDLDIIKFYLCSYIPSLFKLYSGMVSLFIYENYKHYYQGFQVIIEIIPRFKKLILKIAQLIQESNFSECLDRDDIPKYKHKADVEEFLNNFRKKILFHKQQNYFDEAVGTNLYQCRESCYDLLGTFLSAYQLFPHKILHLKDFIRFDPKQSNKQIFKTMKKTLRFNSLFMEKNAQKFIKKIQINNFNFKDPTHCRKFIKTFYKLKKTYFFQFPEESKIFVVLKTKDILKNNINLYIDYFFNEFNQLDLDLKESTIDQSIYTNSKYISLLLMLDNLIKNTESYRKTFYEVLNNKLKSENNLVKPIESFRKIWKLHRDLFYFCLYKPFLNQDWTEIYTLYFLVSNFIQNLCEDNSIFFKKWFHENKTIMEFNKSMFQNYFQMFEIAFNNSNVYKNKSLEITLSDKPELFYILTRLTEGVTEFINGSSIYTQMIVYRFKINIWVGIVLRVVNDVESLFYELKWHVLNYILGLTEGYDEKVIEFLATNFPVSKLYQHCIKLIKMLFARQSMLKTSRGKLIRYVKEEDLETYRIQNTYQIIDYYRKYDETFSDHAIMNVVIKIYQFMRDISTKVVRYENFILEKNEAVKQYNQNKTYDKMQVEEIFIWEFLNRITVAIEIIVKEEHIDETKMSQLESIESDTDDQEQNENYRLRIFYFKKIPICFFLNDYTKKKFREHTKIDSLLEKHEDFFDKMEQFKIEVEDLRKLYIKSKFLYYSSKEVSFYIYKMILYFFATIINILLLVSYNPQNRKYDQRIDAKIYISILSIIQIFFSFMFLILWFYVKFPSLKKMELENYFLVHSRKDKIPFLKKIQTHFFKSMLANGEFQSFFFNFLFAILGIFVSPFFYTLSLLLAVHLSLLVKNVALSFIYNYNKLFYTLIIILVVINSFAYLLAEYYRNQFNDEDLGDEAFMQICDTYFRCFINVINLGLRGGGGISDYLKLQDDTTTNFYGRFFFDLFFFIFVNLILLGIFFGIIVDSFSDFNENSTKRQEDYNNVCFVCGLQKARLEKRGINFQEHLHVHDIWKYFFYVLYLKWKPKNYYDGVDIYVDELLKKDYNDSWLPKQNCLALEKKNKTFEQITSKNLILNLII